MQLTSYDFKASDVVQLGTTVKGETKTSVWELRLQKRRLKKNVGDPMPVAVEDLIELAMCPGELWVVLNIKGWPEKAEPKCCYCL